MRTSSLQKRRLGDEDPPAPSCAPVFVRFPTSRDSVFPWHYQLVQIYPATIAIMRLRLPFAQAPPCFRPEGNQHFVNRLLKAVIISLDSRGAHLLFRCFFDELMFELAY